MGRPKGLLLLHGQPLLRSHVLALGPFASRVVVALGCDAGAHRAVLPAGCHVVHNPEWRTTWPADTLRLALLEADVRDSCWVTPVDVPPAAAPTLATLLEHGAPVVPVSERDMPGHPVLLDRMRVESVRQAAPEGGLRSLLTDVPRVSVDQNVAIDFDDPEAWRRFLGGGSG